MKRYLKYFCIGLCSVIVMPSFALVRPNAGMPNGTQLKVLSLKTERLTDPTIIEAKDPALSWQMVSTAQGKMQHAYRVIVAGSAALLLQNKGDLWDSGKVPSTNSTQVIYKGKSLTSRQKVYWKVMLWDEQDRPSAWSPVAKWQMGLLDPADWKGKWIGAMQDPNPNAAVTYAAPYFRKGFTVQKKIKQATTYISGLGFYELYINGKKIGDQVLAPAVTNYDKRPLTKLLYPYDDQSTQRVLYNSFDVTTSIAKNNAIGILLGNGWYNQRDRTVEGNMWYDMPKLIFQLEITYTDGTKDIIASDNSWKTNTGPLLKDGIFSGERYDARLDLGAWDQPGYNDANWERAILVRPPVGALHPQLAPFDKVTRTLTPNFEGKISDSIYRYRLNETVSGWASINVKGKPGDRVKIRYISEEGEDYGQADIYTLKGGDTELWHPKFTWHAFRTIEVTSKAVTLNANSIKVMDVHTDVAPNGTFECANPFFNKINTAYLKTQLANMHGSISSDCPHRERLGYTGDGQVAMESALISFDLPLFYSKWFDDMDDARNKRTGFVTHTAPFGGGGGGPAWGSAYVIMPWLHYQYYNDPQILSKHYPGMKQWVTYLSEHTNKEGLIDREEPKGWCLGDWCTPEPVQVPEPLVNTAYYYHVTTTMAKVAGLLGKDADREMFDRIAKQIKIDFSKAYYNAANKTYWQGRQGADVFALAFDLVPTELHKDVFNSLLEHLKKLDHHFDTGILATPLLLKVLSQNNRDDIAYKIMDQRSGVGFGYLLNENNSTLWEAWDSGGSHCHPMFGSVVEWFYSALGGIKPGINGFQKFLIAPSIVNDLMQCKVSYNSAYGKIRSEWVKKGDGSYQFLMEVPANTSATFVLPPGKTIAKGLSGKKLLIKQKAGQNTVDLGSGVYQLTVL